MNVYSCNFCFLCINTHLNRKKMKLPKKQIEYDPYMKASVFL